MAVVVRRQPGLRVLSLPETVQTRLAVWGDPIAHSRSPQLHAAAYRVLALPWRYERRRVTAEAFGDALEHLGGEWRGLSLTMPLKSVAFAAAQAHDRHSRLTGVANTLLLAPSGVHAFNTDVGGLRRSMEEEGITAISRARIVGAGATATSALIALCELGAEHIEVVARREGAAADVTRLGAQLGATVQWTPFHAGAYAAVPVTVATLPGGAQLAAPTAAALSASGGHLVDVVYGQWPTALATAWADQGGTASSGRGMLLHQALLQVRIFARGDADVALDDEEAVLAEMRSALMGD